MGSHRHLRFPSMSFIYKCSFRKPEWCFCFSRFGEESFFASTVTRLKPALSVFSIAIELKLIIACKGTDNKLVSQDGFHRTLTIDQQFNAKTVGAYRIRPHMSDKAQRSTKSYQRNHSIFAYVRAY